MENYQNEVANIYHNTITTLDEVLVGQRNVKKTIAASILSDTNSKILLTGNTGVGKTSLVNYLAKSFNSERISVTSDMIPSDIQEQLKNSCDLNFLQIDEFNRASGKVQSTFIELFAEKQMSIGGVRYTFPDFYVFATQNSSDIAGIFNVPQAVYDRFDINIFFDSLTDEEKRLLLFGDFKASTNSNLALNDINYVKNAIEAFKTNKDDENLMMQIFDLIDSQTLEGKKLFAGSNIRAHRFALKLAKLMALTEGGDYLLSSDIADFIKYLYMHRIDQNVVRMTDDNVADLFYDLRNDVLSLKRKRKIR